MILNQAQAEAVYSAMCALNSVGATIGSISMHDEQGLAIAVHTTSNGMWMIKSARKTSEWHDNQSAFATAYGLNIKEAPAEPAAHPQCIGGDDCGWDDKSKMGDICRVCGEQIPF